MCISRGKQIRQIIMFLYFVRHGEIESNIRKVYAGWSEEPLTEKGIQQAEMAGEVLKEKGIDALYCSPLRRAVQTAEIIGEAVGLTPVSDDHFKEMRLGPWEGLSEDEVARRFPEEWKIWNKRPADLVLEGRETLRELQERVLEGVRRRRSPRLNTLEGDPVQLGREVRERLKMNVEHPTSNIQHRMGKDRVSGQESGNVVVVTHVAIIRVLKLYAEGRDLNEYKKVPVENGEVFELDPQITQISAD